VTIYPNTKSSKLFAEETLVPKFFFHSLKPLGSATLVQSLQDNIIYVAKKVVLGGLNQKEQDGAHLEVNICFGNRNKEFRLIS